MSEMEYCLARGLESGRRFECTLEPNHKGNHKAGAGLSVRGLENVAYEWPNENESDRERPADMSELLVDNSAEVMHKWAMECQRVHRDGVVGDWTFTGILSEFLRDILGYPTITGL